jgi:hypothetical protein
MNSQASRRHQALDMQHHIFGLAALEGFVGLGGAPAMPCR